MAAWVKCKSSADENLVIWVNLTIAQTMIWEGSRERTVIRFGASEDDAVHVSERPEELIKRAGESGNG